MEQETIILVSVFGGVSLLLLVLVAVLFSQVTSLKRRIEDLNASGRLRVQKLKMDSDKNHAFHNPVISPDEELAKRGFTMYAKDDVESGRSTPPPRQTGGQFLDELSRELDYRHRRQEQQQKQTDFPQSRRYQNDYQQTRQEQVHNSTRQQESNRSKQQNDYQQRQQQNDYQQRQQQNDYQQRQNDYQQRQKDVNLRSDYQKQNAPPFLLQSIEENKRKMRQMNSAANGRQSDTNPNFIY